MTHPMSDALEEDSAADDDHSMFKEEHLEPDEGSLFAFFVMSPRRLPLFVMCMCGAWMFVALGFEFHIHGTIQVMLGNCDGASSHLSPRGSMFLAV